MKRLRLRDGVVMGHPYEVAELMQEHANENLEALTSAAFQSRGVLAPHTSELFPAADAADIESGLRLSVRPGFALVEEGIIRVEEETGVTIHQGRYETDQEVYVRDEGAWTGPVASGPEAWLNLHYSETKDTPAKLVPYGNGEVELRVVPGFELRVEESAPDIQTGVPVGRITPSLAGEPAVEDRRTDQAARLRADQTMLEDLVDPALTDDIEALFSRENFVEEIEALLDEQKLQGEFVVTRPREAVEPFFIRTETETSTRAALRDLNSIEADVDLRPNPSWDLEVEWNLYGVRVDAASDTTFTVNTNYDLTEIDYQGYDKPLYLRYEGTLHPIASIDDATTVTTQEPVSRNKDSDPNGAITNGAEEFHVTAEPGIRWFRQNKRSSDFSVDSEVRAPLARLNVEPGFWNVIVQSEGENSRSTDKIGVEIPELSAPKKPGAVEVSGEQREPAFEDDGETIPANPFNKVEVGDDGEPKINRDEIDRYVDEVREELRRIQEQEVSISLSIQPKARNRDEAERAMTIGYDVTIEMLTGEGWKEERTTTIHRNLPDLMRELTWLDLSGRRYRGSVQEKSDLTNLSHNMSRLDVTTDSDRPIRENEIVHVNNDSVEDANNGYWRYEPKMRPDQAEGLTNAQGEEIRTYPYGNDDGYWLQIDVENGSFQARPVTATFNGIKGGADYRIRVRSLGEDGQTGEETVQTTEELRNKFNARLGVDFHQTINDIFAGYKSMMGAIDPGTFNEYLNDRLEEIRGIIDRAALYGTPPKVTGPFEVVPTPGTTRFSGRNLGSVQRVMMRYVPPGRSADNPIVREANFKVLVGQGDPQVAIKDLPSLAELSKEASPVITLEFNAGARGSDFFSVRYRERRPAVVGPSVVSFKGTQTINLITETTYGNTASYWRYDSRVGSTETPRPYGPFPKRWPAEASWDTQAGIFDEPWGIVETEPLDGYGLDTDFTVESDPSEKQRKPVETESVRAIQLQAKRMVPSDILDIRLRNLPSEKLVPQIAYEEIGRFENQVRDPFYYALRYKNDQVTIYIPDSAIDRWTSQSFALEYVYYPTSLQGGDLNDGRGVFLVNRGSQSSAPENPSVGDYYYDEDDTQGKIYDEKNGTNQWTDAETIEFRRHTFSVQRDPTSDARPQTTETRFVLDAPSDTQRTELADASPKIGYHTPEEAGDDTPPFARSLVDGSELELLAPVSVQGSSNEYIFDEWRTRANGFEKNRDSLSDGTRALEGTRRTSSFGVPSVQSKTSVRGESASRILSIARYKKKKSLSGTVDSHISHQESGKSRALVTVDGTNYLINWNGEIDFSAGTDVSIQGIKTSWTQEWDGSGPYPVIRALSVSEDAADPVVIEGPSQAAIQPSDGSKTLTYTVNRTGLDNYSVNWISDTLAKTVDASEGTNETIISVTVDWRNFFGDDVRLEELRPREEIGEEHYDGPRYRPEDVFDFRAPSLRVKSLSLRVSAEKDGVSSSRYTAIQVIADDTGTYR
jgi:hypothetical protein